MHGDRLASVMRPLFTVAQFIFSSTVLVDAPTLPGHPIPEDWPPQPKWPYPHSKVRTEEVISRERGATPAVILRLAGVYDDLGQSVPLPRQIQRIFERDPTAYVYPGVLAHGQPFVHLDDVVDLARLLVEWRRALPPETPLLVGEPGTVSYGELQVLLGRLIHGETWRGPGSFPRARPRWGDCARLGCQMLH